MICPDQHKTQKIRDKAVLQNSGTLESLHDCYKNRKVFNQAVNKYGNA